jgi:flavodoxin
MKNKISRRTFLKSSAIGVTALFTNFSFIQKAFANNSRLQNLKGKKVLIAYFSWSGNTRHMAKMIKSHINADLVEIKTVTPYSNDYEECKAQAKEEQRSSARPKLLTKIKNADSYDAIFIGYPNWWGTVPMALFTFFEKYNFNGKTIIPFTTHEGSYFGDTIYDLKDLNPKSTFIEGLAIRGRSVRNSSSKENLNDWMKNFNA